MYPVSLLLLILAADGYSSDGAQCNYVFSHCHGDVNNYNVIGYNPPATNYCTTEDVPENDEISYTVGLWDGDERGDLTDSLKIEFTAPKRECKYGITLLVNPSIKDERECAEYKFEKADDINSSVHTIEKIVCVRMNTDQLVRYNDNSTVSACKDNIQLWFQYIFTGCYALRFHVGRNIIRGHRFLNTTYRPKEVTEPHFICKYDTHSNLDQRQEVNFTLDTSLPADTGLLLKVQLISINKDVEKPCVWNGESPIYNGTISLLKNDYNCNVKPVTVNGESLKTVQCNIQVQTTQSAGYCFIFYLIDDRCHKNTFWKPPINGELSCTWIKRCVKTTESWLHVENSNTTNSDKLQISSSYLLLPIIAIVLIVSAIVGTLCFLHYLRIRKEEVNLYVNPQHDDFLNSACLKSTNFDIVDNDTDKGIERDHFTCDDIVLLYTKSSPSFMALMKDFRETLAKMCSCSVYDWHDGAEWNDVAKVGAVLWFTKLLNSGCRVIWIDTAATRSIIISNSRESSSNLNKLSKYYEIGDFRDMAFPVVLDLAKRNIRDAMHQYRRHFVVRFEGLESTANVNDPFLDLSPHARYRMPQHLAQLCSDLLVVKAVISKYQIKAEEDLLQQRLRFIKME